MSRDDRYDLIDQEQLAAQLVAVMDAHFHRPNAEEKARILSLAAQQVNGQEFLKQPCVQPSETESQ